MSIIRSLTIGKLTALIQGIISDAGDADVTVDSVVTAALDRARVIAALDTDAILTRWLRVMARDVLKRKPSYSRVPVLIEGLEIPYRIAVPPPQKDDGQPISEDDEDSRVRWICSHKATIAEVRRNIAMRDSQIDGQIRERDAVRLLVDTAAMHAAGDESMTIEEAIRRGREVDGAVA